MEEKYCSGPDCLQNRPISMFNRKGTYADGRVKLQSWCRDCNKKRSKQYYADNPEKHKAEVRKRNIKVLELNRARIIAYLVEHPCKDCNTDDIRVLEFDHLRDKFKNVSKLLQSSYPWETILKEIDKCEVVCANCHRIRTMQRSGSYRLGLDLGEKV